MISAEDLIGTCWRVYGYILKVQRVSYSPDRVAGVFLKVERGQDTYKVGQEYITETKKGALAGWVRVPEYEDPEFQQKQKIAKFTRFLNRVEKRHLKNVPKK